MSKNYLATADQDYFRKLNDFECGWLYEFNFRYYKGGVFEPKYLTQEQYEKAGCDANVRHYRQRNSIEQRAGIKSLTSDLAVRDENFDSVELNRSLPPSALGSFI